MFSDDGRWFWTGTAWIPTPPAPGVAWPSGRGSWDGRSLDLVLGFPVRAVAWLCAGMLGTALVSAAAWFADFGFGQAGLVWPPLLLTCFMASSIIPAILKLVFDLRTVHLDAAGVVTKRPGRPPRFVPWEKVRQVGTFYQMVPLVCIDIDPTYWTDRSRLAPYRPSLFGGWTSFTGSEHMVLLQSRRLPITEADFMRCVRTLAPATVSVHQGLGPEARQPYSR